MGTGSAFQLGPFPSPEETIPWDDVSFPRLWRMESAVTQVLDVGGEGCACCGLSEEAKQTWKEERWGRGGGHGDPLHHPSLFCGIGQVLSP